MAKNSLAQKKSPELIVLCLIFNLWEASFL